jgi:polysaccharide biosynthesis protein PslG
MRSLRVLFGALAIVALMAAPAAAQVPPGFFGVVPQAPPSETDFARMSGTVETMRLPIFWSECEPAPGEFDFAAVDEEVGAAAAHGIRVLPFVYGSPDWVEKSFARPPLNRAALPRWRKFLHVLVERYGPGGTFWAHRRRPLPIRRWQIWNEPNFKLFWEPRIAPAGYARLLHASATTIRAADPGAKIVLAGIAPVGDGMRTWIFIRRLLRVPGVRRDFDFAAIHPYSATIPELDFQLEKVRAAMVAGGAGRKPLIVTEFGVASGGGYPSAFVLGAHGQAAFLRRAYARLLSMRHRWHLAGAYWFTWQDGPRPDPHCGFCQGAGLFRLNGTAKPAWSAFRHLVAAARR